jgi:predicted ATPase/class 3 adenylate cyclase
MRCPACGAAIEGRFRFCPECGQRISTSEPQAGAPAPPPGAASLDGERRQVTILFCDLVGSTAIAERLDPEEYHDLLQQYLTVAFPAIYRFEGVVNTLAGDGLMALFGAPVAHEDDPQRAVRAALAVRDAVAGLAERVVAEGGPGLTVRIGVHSGPVVVGGFGTDLKRDYTAIGDTPNVAARLQSLAAPGGILISEATHRLVQGFFHVRPAGELVVKGKSEPVHAYEVLRRQATATAMSIAAERGLTPFAGRERELAQLDEACAALGRRQSQVVTVVGDAGVGKSRLVYEFRRRMAGEPIVFFESYCSSISQGIPYHPILDMLRRYFGVEVGDRHESAGAKIAGKLGAPLERLEQSYPLLTRLLSRPYAERRDVPADELKRETFDAVARLLVGVSHDTPVVVVIEDLHWADEPSRELLASLVSAVARSRIMLLITTRPENEPAWRTRAARTRLPLAPLSDDGVRAMARAIVGGALPRDIEDRLVARAAGSPFFAEEFTRALVESGDLVADNGGVRLVRASVDVPIPATVQEVIAARLDRLPSGARRVLQMASVLGRQFRAADVAALAEDDTVDVAGALAELERRGLLHRKHGGADDDLRFGESLTQEVSYEGLLLRQRRVLHDRAAALFEARVDGDGMERSAVVAYHRARGDDRRAAVHALLAAAREAEAVPSYPTAVQFYDQAAKLADRALADGEDGLEQAALEGFFGVARLVVLFGLPMLREGAAAAERARALAERLDAKDVLPSLIYFQGILVMSLPGGDFGEGLALAEKALRYAHEGQLELQVRRLSRGLAINYALDGQTEKARQVIMPSLLELERTEADPPSDLYLSARWVRAFVHFAEDELDEAAAYAEDTFAAAVSVGNRTMQSIVGTSLAQIALLRGENLDAKRHADRAFEIAEAIGNANTFPAAASVALLARRALGEPVDVEEYLDRIERGLDPHGLVQMNFRFINEAWMLAGDPERFVARLQEMRGTPGGRLRRALVALTLGDVYGRLGRMEAARAAHADALALAGEIQMRTLLVQVAASAVGLGESGLALVRPHLPAAMAACRRLRLERYRGTIERALLAGLEYPITAQSESRA